MTDKLITAIRGKEGTQKKKRTHLQVLSTVVFIFALVFHQFQSSNVAKKQTTDSMRSAETMRQLESDADADGHGALNATKGTDSLLEHGTQELKEQLIHEDKQEVKDDATEDGKQEVKEEAENEVKEGAKGDNQDKLEVKEGEQVEQDRQQQQQPQQREQLNVIIFYPDDWSAHDVGVLDEHKILKTPTFDRLTKEGMHFLYNAVTTSICWISRATLFTGQYVSNHGSTYLFRPHFVVRTEQWNLTWPFLLQQAGYWVGHVGKWQYQDKGGRLGRIFNYSNFFEGWIKSENGAGEPTYIAEIAKDQILKFLRERPKDRPFAATVAFYPPKGVSKISLTKPEFAALYENVTHPQPPVNRAKAYSRLPPFIQNNATEARQRYLWRFETNGNYQETVTAQYATLSHIDNIVGQVLQELKAQGVYDKTLIIITADNGEFNGARALADKWYPYEESIRVPLIIVDPRMPKDKIGTTSDAFTLNIDLAETILGAAGLDAPPEMDGRDIADLYLESPKSTKPWREEFYYEFPDINGKIPPSYALVRKDWKYIRWWMHNHEELFNLKDDPVEINNLVNKPQYAAIRDELKHHLEVLRHDVFAHSGSVPGTSCDTTAPAGTNYDKLPKCSPTLPDRCCA
jgi:arylsulfatase